MHAIVILGLRSYLLCLRLSPSSVQPVAVSPSSSVRPCLSSLRSCILRRRRPSISPRPRPVASIVHVYSSPRLLLWYLCISSTRLSCPFVGRHLRVSFFVLASWVCRVPVLSRQGVPCTLSSWFLSVRVCRVPNLRGNLSVLSPDVHLSPRPSFVSPFLSCCQLRVLAPLRNIRLTAHILSTSPPIVFPAVSPICLQSFSVSSAPPPPLVQFIDTLSHIASCRRNLASLSHRYLRLLLSSALFFAYIRCHLAALPALFVILASSFASPGFVVGLLVCFLVLVSP